MIAVIWKKGRKETEIQNFNYPLCLTPGIDLKQARQTITFQFIQPFDKARLGFCRKAEKESTTEKMVEETKHKLFNLSCSTNDEGYFMGTFRTNFW